MFGFKCELPDLDFIHIIIQNCLSTCQKKNTVEAPKSNLRSALYLLTPECAVRNS